MSIHICDCCGKPIPDDAGVCPHCGAEQQEDIRLTKIPETIDELRAFCDAKHMPLERMRFFIGEDDRGARAFGIYRGEDGDCVVYKNKSDGTRAVRYKGPDEKRAVRELYEKLKSETELRRGEPRQGASTRVLPDAPSSAPRRGGAKLSLGDVLERLLGHWKLILLVLLAAAAVRGIFSPNSGYYRYRDDMYYYYRNHWYFYDDAVNGWERAYDVPEYLKDNWNDYWDSEEYDIAYGVLDFTYTDYYNDDHFSLFGSGGYDDYDSGGSYDDYDWDDYDYDSWDSGDTDWDSDW
ncbi:MAG: hypothetical protein IJU66_05455 [Oscillospiraceae bacterium]|nr:hypothetical protein [Oscillospiraceae bacterium]